MLEWLDKIITRRAGKTEEEEIYQARWVWYHTILCGLIFISVILQIAILLAIILK